MKNLKFPIYNAFGHIPTTNYTAAGLDFYVPHITTDEEWALFMDAAQKSYNVSLSTIENLVDRTMAEYKLRNNDVTLFTARNIVMLFLSYVSDDTYNCELTTGIYKFITKNVVFSNGVPGVKMSRFDGLFVNSGIKVALMESVAGIYFNKSGRGKKGFDVRAQVVDEDYSGYVHLNVQYLGYGPADIYCGDKLTQMVLLPIIHPEIESVNAEEYATIMKNAARGSNGFGSGDAKH